MSSAMPVSELERANVKFLVDCQVEHSGASTFCGPATSSPS